MILKKLSSRHLSNHLAPSVSYRQALVNVPETVTTKLSNGLTVASEFGNNSQTATVGFWINSGSRYENQSNNGAAHFLEHMIFKGTSKYNKTQLETMIENYGAHLNAYTSREMTAYYSRCLTKHIPLVTDLLGNILTDSVMSDAAIEEEKGTILREKEEIEKQMDEVLFDHLHATAYQGTSLGLTILGTDDNIKNMKRSDLVAFREALYVPDRITLVSVGGNPQTHDALCQFAEKLYPAQSNPTKKPSFAKAEFTGSEIRIRDDSMKEIHIGFSVESVGWTHKDFYPLLVAQTILGSWDKSLGSGSHLSSKLAQLVSSGDLCNSFTSFNTTYSDTGLIGVYVKADNHLHATKLIDLTEGVLKCWRRGLIYATDADVYRAKNQLKTGLLFGLDSTVAVAEEIGRQILCYGERQTPFQVSELIDAVTLDQVREVSEKYLYDADPAVVGIGAIEALPDYNVVRQGMVDWFQ